MGRKESNQTNKSPCELVECRTKHPATKHPMPFFDTPDKTSRIDLPPRTLIIILTLETVKISTHPTA